MDGFICRAYTVDYSEEKPLCLLHSDTTIGLGVSSLVARPNVIYKEQEPCLDCTFTDSFTNFGYKISRSNGNKEFKKCKGGI